MYIGKVFIIIEKKNVLFIKEMVGRIDNKCIGFL